jgi:PQQ-dependent dehydrogenase (s-GDH family)
MKNLFAFLSGICILFAGRAYAQDEPFSRSLINTKSASPFRLAHPFEIIYGPDDYLYITERIGRVIRVDPVTGIKQELLNMINNGVYVTVTRAGGGPTPHATSIGQDGMMGMALHPGFPAVDSIFIAYTNAPGSLRISRFKFNNTASPSLTGETVLISGLPANNDHSSGRLIIGGDGMLYYTCGDKGANQFANRCSSILSQLLPTAAQLSASNYSYYSGKVLRICRDGSIPSDNPVMGGLRSHIFTMGHRNPQGLVWQKNPTTGYTSVVSTPGGRLFSSEHGPRTDDEINILQSGKNYGWPNIAGYLDNINYTYINWSTASGSNCSGTPYTENTIPGGATVLDETDVPIANFQPPLSTMYTACTPLPASVCDAGGTDWMKYPTIAPSSIDFYHVDGGYGIPGWYPSLIVPTLRRGVVYRYTMNSTMDGFVSDSIPYFRTSNRYRDIAISRDGLRIYLVTDSIGQTSGPSGNGTSALADRGAIIEYYYTGATLPLSNKPVTRETVVKNKLIIYPNPAKESLHVDLGETVNALPVNYRLMDMTGRILIKGISREKKININTSALGRGMYLLTIINANGLELKTEKVIIQ